MLVKGKNMAVALKELGIIQTFIDRPKQGLSLVEKPKRSKPNEVEVYYVFHEKSEKKSRVPVTKEEQTLRENIEEIDNTLHDFSELNYSNISISTLTSVLPIVIFTRSNLIDEKVKLKNALHKILKI